MGVHPEFPKSPYAELFPQHRWFPAAEELRAKAYERLLPPLVARIRDEVYEWRHDGYSGASDTSRALLRWWFGQEHPYETGEGTLGNFRYYFAQQEAVETLIWLHDVRKARDKFDLLRKQANEIDSPKSPFKAIVSVLMLQEGWDVRNVTVIVGLRAYVSEAKILPEQTFGRGLRRMYFGTGTKETVSLMGTPAFMEFVKSIQAEGVSFEHRPMGEGPPRQDSLVVEVDDAADVAAFAKNYVAVGFKLDYVRADGDLSNYIPDFIVRTASGGVFIVETKGREEIDLPQKMRRMKEWCADATSASRAISGPAYRHVFVDQEGFEKHTPRDFAGLVKTFREFQE